MGSRGDIPAFTPAEAGTRFSDPGGMQGWVFVCIPTALDPTISAAQKRYKSAL